MSMVSVESKKAPSQAWPMLLRRSSKAMESCRFSAKVWMLASSASKLWQACVAW